MAKIETAILIQDSLYEQATALANEMQISQSELFALALEEYLQRNRNRRNLLQSINEAYADDLDPSEQAMLERMRRHQRQLLEKEW
jgi:metal-responsive CopG/Arc/MetJ family transcriptional regulator